jgi:hypothetical protein
VEACCICNKELDAKCKSHDYIKKISKLKSIAEDKKTPFCFPAQDIKLSDALEKDEDGTNLGRKLEKSPLGQIATTIGNDKSKKDIC